MLRLGGGLALGLAAARLIHEVRLVARGAGHAGEQDVIGVDAVERVEVELPRRLRESVFLSENLLFDRPAIVPPSA